MTALFDKMQLTPVSQPSRTGIAYRSTKTYGHNEGLSCCFRQWRASHSHCQQVHGYALAFRFVFATHTLDENNWCLDFGGLKDGYGSDTTRTVHVGEPTDEERDVFEVVRRAQQAGFEAVRPGVACQEIDRAARKVISDAGYGEYFIHRVGHGIGLTTHEPPYMVEGEEHLIEPGMCFSIEPGIYLPDRFGVRIEDIVAVTEDGGRRFNHTSREMQLVE